MPVNIVKDIDGWISIRTVLISVSDKTNLEVLVSGLVQLSPDVRILSTGGTFVAIAAILGPDLARRHLVQVADYTGQPETQGGLVKTLDFRIYLGLLTETYNPAHQADLARASAVPIDMVVVNLYPFRETIGRATATVEHARANIDIGGPCMIRAAAKNYLRVAAVVDPGGYEALLAVLRQNNGRLDLAERFRLAQQAFEHTAAYDAAIAAYLRRQIPTQVDQEYDLRDSNGMQPTALARGG